MFVIYRVYHKDRVIYYDKVHYKTIFFIFLFQIEIVKIYQMLTFHNKHKRFLIVSSYMYVIAFEL